MPIISIFFGLIIRVYHDDHPPPHFHVQYGEWNAIIEIRTGKVLIGQVPRRLMKLVEEWRKQHKFELLRAFNDAQNFKIPKKIKGLE